MVWVIFIVEQIAAVQAARQHAQPFAFLLTILVKRSEINVCIIVAIPGSPPI